MRDEHAESAGADRLLALTGLVLLTTRGDFHAVRVPAAAGDVRAAELLEAAVNAVLGAADGLRSGLLPAIGNGWVATLLDAA